MLNLCYDPPHLELNGVRAALVCEGAPDSELLGDGLRQPRRHLQHLLGALGALAAAGGVARAAVHVAAAALLDRREEEAAAGGAAEEVLRSGKEKIIETLPETILTLSLSF